MKKIICLLLAFILVFAMISCSDDTDPVDNGQAGGTEEPDTSIPNYPGNDIFTDEDGNQNLPIIPVPTT